MQIKDFIEKYEWVFFYTSMSNEWGTLQMIYGWIRGYKMKKNNKKRWKNSSKTVIQGSG